MGMYDNLWCRRILPDGLDGKDYTFQTKSLECNLWQYEILDNGTLVRHDLNDESSQGSSRKYRVIDHHGYVLFYHGVRKGIDIEWHEYSAKFTDGYLVEITAKPVNTY